MIVFIICALVGLVGAFILVLENILSNKARKWRKIKDSYKEYLDDDGYYFYGFDTREKNPDYNEEKFNYATKKYEYYRDIDFDMMKILGGFLTGVGLFAVIICAMVALAANVGSNSEIEYQTMLEERTAIEREMTENPDNPLLYQSISDFNKKVIEIKIRYDSPWVNWYQNAKIAENIDMIEVDNNVYP